MVDHEMPDNFCDDSGAVAHLIEIEASDLLLSARDRQIRNQARDGLGYFMLAAALSEIAESQS